MKSAKSNRLAAVESGANESCPAVDGVTHRPGVYKIPMVRMNESSDEYPNVRVYIFKKSKRLQSNLLVREVK